jgi:hypothetical protein
MKRAVTFPISRKWLLGVLALPFICCGLLANGEFLVELIRKIYVK